jgi:hypothetical protein
VVVCGGGFNVSICMLVMHFRICCSSCGICMFVVRYT